MGTLTQSLFEKQKKLDWFSNLTEDNRNVLIRVYKKNINNLLNEDIIYMYDKYHKSMALRSLIKK